MIMIMCASLFACGKSGGDAEEKKEINIACAETTQALVEKIVPVMEEKGYKVEYKVFDNNMNTLVACNDASVDAVFVVISLLWKVSMKVTAEIW